MPFCREIYPTVRDSVDLGLYCVQFFMGNPKSYKRHRIAENDIKKVNLLTWRYPMEIFSHFPYISNLAGKSTKDGLAWNGNIEIDNKLNFLISEIEYELSVLGKIGNGVVIHPGSHPNREKGLDAIAKSINKINFPENSVLILENCAGEGNKLCKDFNEIAHILNKVENKDHVGVCVDTAHLWGVGDYDISKISEIKRLFTDFDNFIGLEKFKLLHLNDSKVPLGSKKDRHEHLGKGYIWGKDQSALFFLIKECQNLDIPIILETGGPCTHTIFNFNI